MAAAAAGACFFVSRRENTPSEMRLAACAGGGASAQVRGSLLCSLSCDFPRALLTASWVAVRTPVAAAPAARPSATPARALRFFLRAMPDGYPPDRAENVLRAPDPDTDRAPSFLPRSG